jgi:hypothetical protein
MPSSPENRRILERIGEDEKRHYEQWKRYIGSVVLGLVMRVSLGVEV